MAPFSPPAAVRPNTAPASSARSRRAGCGGTNPGPTSNSPTPAPSYSPDGSDGLEASLRQSDPAAPAARQLVTLEDAAGYIMKLPKAEQNLGEWQAAIECLILVAEKNGPTMMARIGMMKALNRHVVREFNPDRKDSNWGKRKLKRDQ